MTTGLKNFGMIVLKNALNAVLTNAGLVALMHGEFNAYSTNGLWNIGKATLVVIATREATVWGPILLKWTQTNSDPSVTITQTPEK